jgi:hypothetical protein
LLLLLLFFFFFFTNTTSAAFPASANPEPRDRIQFSSLQKAPKPYLPNPTKQISFLKTKITTSSICNKRITESKFCRTLLSASSNAKFCTILSLSLSLSLSLAKAQARRRRRRRRGARPRNLSIARV